jgi:hypothetical protein
MCLRSMMMIATGLLRCPCKRALSRPLSGYPFANLCVRAAKTSSLRSCARGKRKRKGGSREWRWEMGYGKWTYIDRHLRYAFPQKTEREPWVPAMYLLLEII